MFGVAKPRVFRDQWILGHVGQFVISLLARQDFKKSQSKSSPEQVSPSAFGHFDRMLSRYEGVGMPSKLTRYSHSGINGFSAILPGSPFVCMEGKLRSFSKVM
jgi:hypothetical protein